MFHVKHALARPGRAERRLREGGARCRALHAAAQPAVASAAPQEGFDLEAVMRAVEQGELGTIIDATDRDSGERVNIWTG